MNLFKQFKDLFWWTRIVFTFGDVIETRSTETEDDDNQRSVKDVRYNGKIASVQLFLVMTAVSITFSFWKLLVNTNGASGRIVLLMYMLLGLGFLVWFNFHRSKILLPASRNVWPIEYAAQPRDNLNVFGITLFYFFGCVLDIFHIFLAGACFDVWNRCQDYYYVFSDSLHICSHIVRIIFFGVQTLFCIVFNKSIVLDKSSTRCGLMCLVAINTSLWFDSFANVAFTLILSNNPIDSLKIKCFADASNATIEDVQCLTQNTTLHIFEKTYMSPIFIPFSIEIAILIGESVCHLFCHCARPTDVNSVRSTESGPRKRGYECLPSNNLPSVANNPDEDGSYTEPLQSGNYISLKHSEYGEETSLMLSVTEGQGSSSNPTVARLSWQVSFLLAFLSNALLLALAILYRVHPETKLYLYYAFPFRAVMITATIIGFHISKDFTALRGIPFTALDYILLVSYTGHLQLSLFAFLARIHSEVRVFAAQNMIDILLGYLQATFILFTTRILPLSANGNSSKPAIFKYLVFFLAVSNGTLWIVETCVGLNLSLSQNNIFKDTVEAKYYKPLAWSIMYNTLAPLDLMFHLLSCFIFTRTFMRLRRILRTGNSSVQ